MKKGGRGGYGGAVLLTSRAVGAIRSRVPAAAAPQQPRPPSPSAPRGLFDAGLASGAETQRLPRRIRPSPLSKQNPLFSPFRGQKGQQALNEKKPDDAIVHFQREEEMAPKDQTGNYNLGTAQSRAGRPAEALASLEKARTEGRGAVAADAAFNAGETLYREKQYEPAAAAFREALKRRPGDADAAWNYELCVRRAEEEKQKEKQQQREKKDPKADKDKTGGKDGKDKQPAANDAQKKQQEEKEFEQNAKMTRDKAEQLLSAIERSDLEEQKKKIAEQRSKRRVARDW